MGAKVKAEMNPLRKIIVIAAMLILMSVGFVIGTLCRYDQLEVGLALPVQSGQVFTPESWDNAVSNIQYAVVGIHTAWRLPWEIRKVELIDGITLLLDLRLGVLGFSEAIFFGEGTFYLPDALNLRGSLFGAGVDKTIIKWRKQCDLEDLEGN